MNKTFVLCRIKILMTSILCLWYILPVIAQNENRNEAHTEHYFQQIQKENDLAKLKMFLHQMPKGGDLHHHYSGSVYVETYLDWVRDNKLYINSTSFHVEYDKAMDHISVDSLRKNALLYRQLLSSWSGKDFAFSNSGQSYASRFFNSFFYFHRLSKENINDGLQKLKKRARIENVQYIETIFHAVDLNVTLGQFDDDLIALGQNRDAEGIKTLLAKMHSEIDPRLLNNAVMEYKGMLEKEHAGIDDDKFTVRFQTYALRNLNPSLVFTQMYAGFAACTNIDALVAINLVGPEHEHVAIRDYWLHMQMLDFFKNKSEFSDVNVALHAGELALGMTRPEDLSFHICDALQFGHAKRIGHGVDIPYEIKNDEIIELMSEKSIPVEINLTSNEYILGISQNEHPINIYRDSNVPVVISTDDAGVSRNNLTNEYVLLASRYNVTYLEIKKFVYNSIQYSFLSSTEKEEQLKELEFRFEQFEKGYAKLSE